MKGYVIKCEPLTGKYQFELYVRSAQGSFGPLYLKADSKYISTRKFLFGSQDEAKHMLSELIKKSEGNARGSVKPRGSSQYLIQLRGENLENFLERNYRGCFQKVSNIEYFRATASYPFFCLNFSDALAMCLFEQRHVNQGLREIYDEFLFPMRLEGKSHKDVAKRLKKPDPFLEQMLKPVKPGLDMINTFLRQLHKENKAEIDYITAKIYLHSLNGIGFGNGA
jgi:hypothetical protein